MPSVPLHKAKFNSVDHHDTARNALPSLLRTPSGLAILEIQGTIHAPFPEAENATLTSTQSDGSVLQTDIGKLEFPLFNSSADADDLRWMKRVYLYVGKHQRLTGEVKKLSKPLVVLSRRSDAEADTGTSAEGIQGQDHNELEILEIVRYKILFGGRPEPVGD